MKPDLLVQEHENTRGFIRDLPDHDLLTLVGRLAMDYFVRMGGEEWSERALVESVGAGVGIGGSVLEAQRSVLG